MTQKQIQSNRLDISNARELLKDLSLQDFLNFGIQEVAYIRTASLEGKTAYAVHAADGTPLSVMESLDSAMLALRQNDLEPVALH